MYAKIHTFWIRKDCSTDSSNILRVTIRVHPLFYAQNYSVFLRKNVLYTETPYKLENESSHASIFPPRIGPMTWFYDSYCSHNCIEKQSILLCSDSINAEKFCFWKLVTQKQYH